MSETKKSHNVFYRLSRVGCEGVTDPQISMRIQFSNRLATALFCLVLPFLAFVIESGELIFVPLVLFFNLAALGVFFLNTKKKYFAAKLYLLFCSNSAVFIFIWMFGRESLMFLHFVSTMITPVLLFSDRTKHSLRGKRIGLMLPVVGLFSMLFLSTPLVVLAESQMLYLRFLSVVTVIISSYLRFLFWEDIYFKNESSAIQKKQELETLFSNLAAGVVQQNEQGAILNFNQQALNILGLSADEITGRTSMDPRWRSIREDGSPFPGDEHPAMVALRTGLPQYKKVMGVHKPSGVLSWLSINASVYFIEKDGELKKKVICTFEDITEETQKAKELKETSSRLEIVMRAVGFGTWDWDFKNNILVWDDFMYQLFGLDKANFEGAYQAFEKTLVKEDAEMVQAGLQATFARKSDYYSGEFRVQHATNGIRNIRAEAKCFYDENGNILRLVGANYDVTELRDAEKKLQAQSLALAQASKMSALGEMSAGVAHEINNPLSIIKGKNHLLKSYLNMGQIDVPKLLAQADQVDEMVNRIAKIIKGLRFIAREGTGDPIENISIQNILEETLVFCQSRFKNHEVKLETDIPTGPYYLDCRAVQISQVILNLLNNAMDAVENLPEKWVKLDVKMIDEEWIQVAVTDSGPGIPADIREKILEPFYTTKPIGKGTGLGLSIAVGIIRGHSGKLEIDSQSPNTRFVITLPVHLDVGPG